MRLGLLVLLVGCQPSGSSENRVIPVVTPTAPSYAADLNNVKGGAVSATIGIEPLPGSMHLVHHARGRHGVLAIRDP